MNSVRSRIGIGLGMCAVASLLGGNTVFGQTGPASTTERVAELETRTNALEKQTDASGIWNSLGFKISGAVEASYTQNFNNPNTNLNQMRIFDTQANSFVPQVAQLVFERQATAGSATDRIGFRARLNFGAQSRFSRARTNFQPGTDNNELDFQELYAEYIAPVGAGLKIQAGKINTLIGYEGINSWENPNFSRSFMFGLSQAFTTTGVRFTYPLGDKGTVALGLVNGWDNIEDNNRGKTFEWKVDLTPHEKFGIAFFGSYGSEQSNGNAAFGNAGTGVCVNGTTGCDPNAKRTVVGSIISIKPTGKTTFILEPYYGNEANASTTSASQNARWNGIIAYFIQDFNDQTQPHAFSVRARGEIWEDAGGVRSCVGGNNFNGGTNVCASSPAGGFVPGAPGAGAGIFNTATGLGTRQTVWEGTFTLQYKPAPALITRAEFRYDKSNENVFLRGTEAVSSQQTLAFSVVYLF
jgi:Putative beta-barrel porin-2, OmpL-like. bbp2